MMIADQGSRRVQSSCRIGLEAGPRLSSKAAAPPGAASAGSGGDRAQVASAACLGAAGGRRNPLAGGGGRFYSPAPCLPGEGIERGLTN